MPTGVAPAQTVSGRGKDWISIRAYVITGAAALVFLYLRIFCLPATPFAFSGDEILFFSRALRIVHGQVLYRDFFELVPPGTDLLYALGFKVFGVHAWVIAAWHIAIGCALSLVLTAIATRILSGFAVYLPMLLFLVFDFSSAMDATHHWFSTLAALAAVSVLVRGIGSGRIAVAGLLCGAAALFTQTQGTLVLLAIALWLALDESPSRERRLAALLLPFALLVASVLGFFVWKAGFHRVFFDLIVFPLTGLSGPVNAPSAYLHVLPPIHGAGDAIRLIPFLVILAFVPYVYFFNLYELRSRRTWLDRTTRRSLLLLNFVGLALCLAIVSGPRFFRICTIASPALLIGAWTISQPGRGRRLPQYALGCAAMAFALWLPLHRQCQGHGILELPIGRTAFTDASRLQELQWLQQRTQPGDYFFNQPMAALYLGLRNPTHAEFVNRDNFTSQEDVTRILDALDRQPARFVVLNPGIPPTAHDHSAPFFDYVRARDCRKASFTLEPTPFVEEVWGPCP